jgi:RNA polymerase sigma factor for flagellar operon FliA
MRGVEEHLTLVEQVVVQVAVNYPRHVDRGELVRAGVLGLVEAANRFDGSRGVPFERFAAQRIRGAVLDAVRAADWAPRSVRAMSRRVESTEQHLANRLSRTPTAEELAEALGTTTADLANFRDRVFRSVVLALDQKMTTDNEEVSLLDALCDRTVLEPSEELEGRELRAYLRDAVSLLPERHRHVIVGYFLEGRTSEQLARFLGVTESRVSQLRSEALVMLKDAIEAQYRDEVVEAEEAASSARKARRKAGYASAVSTRSSWRDRLGAAPAVALS